MANHKINKAKEKHGEFPKSGGTGFPNISGKQHQTPCFLFRGTSYSEHCNLAGSRQVSLGAIINNSGVATYQICPLFGWGNLCGVKGTPRQLLVTSQPPPSLCQRQTLFLASRMECMQISSSGTCILAKGKLKNLFLKKFFSK